MSDKTKPIRPPGLAPEFMTLEEVCAHLGCARRTAFKLLGDGDLRRVRSLGRRTLVTTDSVEAIKDKMLGHRAPRRPARRMRPTTTAVLADAFDAAKRPRTGT